MSILGAISKAKSKFHEQKLKVRSRKLTRESQRLERRKNERIYQEGMAELKSQQAREEARILKAKRASGPSFVERIGAKAVGKGRKTKGGIGGNMKAAALRKGNQYQLGGGPSWGATGGGPSWSSLGPPTMKTKNSYNTSGLWGLGPGKKERQQKKKRGRQIVINMR